MESLKSIQKQLFSRVLSWQKGRMESKTVFVIAQALKTIGKDAFVILFFLLQDERLISIQKLLLGYLLANSLPISIGLLVLVVGLVVLYGGGNQWSDGAVQATQLLFPYIDIIGYPIITASIAIAASCQDFVISMCCGVTVICISLLLILFNIFNFSKSPKAISFFQCREAKVVMASYILELFFCYYLSFRWTELNSANYQQIVAYSFIKLILTILKFKQRVLIRYYINLFAQELSNFFYFIQLNLSIISLALASLQLQLINNNLPFILLIMTILGFVSLKVYLSQRENDLFLSSVTDMRSQDQAMLYLDCLAELTRKIENEQEDIILISLKTRHELVCRNSKCFCYGEDHTLSEFIREYVKGELEMMSELYHNFPNILISILYFKMVLFKFYPEILVKLAQYNTKFNLSLSERFFQYSLTDYVSNFISRKNAEIYAVESQKMFKLQEMRIQMQQLIITEVQIRQKKWRYLSRGLCQVGQLQIHCKNELKSINRMMQIYRQNKIAFKKSKQFNLLFLFYFVKVSFLDNGKELKNNLKQIYYGYKVDQLHSIKEFKKFIYHKRSCALETHIDTKQMGIITTASRNVEDMFGFPYDKVIGSSINTLMPEFIQQQHENIMSNWAKSGTWRTIGKLKEVYCVHKEKHCFSALLYLKIYVKQTGLHFVTNIFKTNDCDFLVMSPTGLIQGLGRKFMNVLREGAKNLPLNMLIETSDQKLQSQVFQQNKLYRRVFMSLKGIEEQTEKYAQSLNCNMNSANGGQTNEQFYKWLCANSIEKHFVQFTVYNYHMGTIKFTVFKMFESRIINRYNTNYFLTKHTSYLSSMRQHLGEQIQVDMEERMSEGSIEESQNTQDIFQNNANSSLTSITEKQNYPLSKMLEKFLLMIQYPQTIKDHRMLRLSWVGIILIVVITLTNFLSAYFYRLTLLEIQNIFFADGAVSDIMQTTEIAYDHIYQLKAKLLSGQFSDFDSNLKSAQYVQNYVYGLKQYSFARLISDKTPMLKKRLYSYIEKPAQWIMENQTLNIQTFQFLQEMYYLTGHLINELSVMRNTNTTVFSPQLLKKLQINFPEMKSLNQYYLQSYQTNSNDSHDALNYTSIGSLLIFAAFSFAFFLLIDLYYRFRFKQVENSFNFFSFIPHIFLEKLRDYYSEISIFIVDKDRLKNIDKNQEEMFAIDTYEIFQKHENTKITPSTKLKLINYSSYYRWIFILIVFFGFNGFNYFATTKVRDFFGPSKNVIHLINNLMRSENRLLETYFQLKGNYYSNPTQNLNSEFFDMLNQHLDKQGLVWNEVANQITGVLSNYDPNFRDNFITSLVTNICSYSAPVLPQSQNYKCTKELKLNILDGGIMIAMNYFLRTVNKAMVELQAQYVTKTQPIYEGNYFDQLSFTELDKMQIYMFKIYQLTQSICYESYINSIDRITSQFLQITIVFTFLFVFLIVLWFLSIPKQKRQLSRLYGQLLLVPFNVLKTNQRIANLLKEAVEFTQ